MVNFGPLTAEIVSRVWDTPANFNGFRVLAVLLHGTLVVGVSQTLRRWTEGATYIRQGGHKQQTLALTLHQPHQWKQWSKRPGDNPFCFRYPFHNPHHYPLQLIFGQRMTVRNDHISIFSSFLISCCMTSLWSPYGIWQTIIFSSYGFFLLSSIFFVFLA